MITAKNKEGSIRKLIYNDSILLLSQDDELSILIEEIDLVFNVKFTQEGEKYKTSGTISDDHKIINLVLHQWDDYSGVEATSPLILNIEKKKFLIKWRTNSTIASSFRNFHFTIWQEL